MSVLPLTGPGGDIQVTLSDRVSSKWHICPANINHHRTVALPTHFHLCNQSFGRQQEVYWCERPIDHWSGAIDPNLFPSHPAALSFCNLFGFVGTYSDSSLPMERSQAQITRINSTSEFLLCDLSPLINIFDSRCISQWCVRAVIVCRVVIMCRLWFIPQKTPF